MRIAIIIAALIATVVAQPLCVGKEYPLSVSTTVGQVQGTYYNGSRAFLGIPFAKPPVGSLRFAQPVPIEKSATTLDATRWPNSCFQASVTSTPGYTQSEDCLYLNVFTPPCRTFTPSPKLSVMVFIHGGRYWTGYSQQFPGDLLASERNTVVVTIQYRLNIFGFQSYDSNTNNGLRDQQLALKWVKDNIEAFGGDASSITIFGESAGGSSVLYHLLMPASYPYYNRAILQSTWQWIIPTLANSRADTVAWAAQSKIGCANVTTTGAPNYQAILACLRALPASKINPTTAEANFMLPMVDNSLITTLPLNSIKNGKYNKNADIAIGHNYDEGNFMAYSRLGFKTPDQTILNATYLSVVNRTLLVYLDQAAANFLLAQYEPLRNKLGNYYGAAQFFGDYYITCGSILAAKYFSDQKTPLFSYIYNYSSSNYPAVEYFLSASHGNELPYVFLQPIYTPYPFSIADDFMAERMSSVWSYFARFKFGFANYPTASYFGPNPYGVFDTVPYKKDFCNIWAKYYQLY